MVSFLSSHIQLTIAIAIAVVPPGRFVIAIAAVPPGRFAIAIAAVLPGRFGYVQNNVSAIAYVRIFGGSVINRQLVTTHLFFCGIPDPPSDQSSDNQCDKH